MLDFKQDRNIIKYDWTLNLLSKQEVNTKLQM